MALSALAEGVAADRRGEMEALGYAVFPSAFDAAMVERLRHAVDDVALATPEALAAFERNPFQGIWSIGESAKVDSTVAELLGAASSRECLARVGVHNPRFSSGFSLSKPPDSPALYWHRDWMYWDQPESDAPMGVQLFLMVYLVDTTPHNGCLRVLPGSHLQKLSLDDELGMQDPRAHGGRSNWSEDWAKDPGLGDKIQGMVSSYPGAVDVAVRAGDLIIGDSRLYHAAYRNSSKAVRRRPFCCSPPAARMRDSVLLPPSRLRWLCSRTPCLIATLFGCSAGRASPCGTSTGMRAEMVCEPPTVKRLTMVGSRAIFPLGLRARLSCWSHCTQCSKATGLWEQWQTERSVTGALANVHHWTGSRDCKCEIS